MTNETNTKVDAQLEIGQKDIAPPAHSASENQHVLEESICTTITKDLKSIFTKTRYAMIPFSSEDRVHELRNWDLWGPLIFCLVLTCFISMGTSNSVNDAFSAVYATLFVGAVVIGLNSYLIGVDASTLSMISILGYCIFPFVIVSIVNYFARKYLMLLGVRNYSNLICRLVSSLALRGSGA